MEAWRGQCPVVIVPTNYYTTPTEDFAKAGISLAIWANHLMRASVRAMQTVAAEIYRAQSLVPVEDQIVPVKELFRITGMEEMKAAEGRYLPARAPAEKAGAD